MNSTYLSVAKHLGVNRWLLTVSIMKTSTAGIPQTLATFSHELHAGCWAPDCMLEATSAVLGSSCPRYVLAWDYGERCSGGLYVRAQPQARIQEA